MQSYTNFAIKTLIFFQFLLVNESAVASEIVGGGGQSKSISVNIYKFFIFGK